MGVPNSQFLKDRLAPYVQNKFDNFKKMRQLQHTFRQNIILGRIIAFSLVINNYDGDILPNFYAYCDTTHLYNCHWVGNAKTYISVWHKGEQDPQILILSLNICSSLRDI